MKKKLFFLLVFFCMAFTGVNPFITTLYAVDIDDKKKQIIIKTLKKWVKKPIVINSILIQNQKHKNLTKDKILEIDKKWRKETTSTKRPTINSLLKNKLSNYLKELKSKNNGLFTEIFVMDNKGLNVGISDPTSDYYQGDEAKWQETYLKGSESIHVSDVEFDDSSQSFQFQISFTVSDKNKAIGTLTVGVDAEVLEKLPNDINLVLNE